MKSLLLTTLSASILAVSGVAATHVFEWTTIQKQLYQGPKGEAIVTERYMVDGQRAARIDYSPERPTTGVEITIMPDFTKNKAFTHATERSVTDAKAYVEREVKEYLGQS